MISGVQPFFWRPVRRFIATCNDVYYLASMRYWRSLIALLLVLACAAAAVQKLNLNAATKEQLVAQGFSESQALQVIAHRDKSGPLLQVEELLAVPQMKKETFEKVRDRVTVDE